MLKAQTRTRRRRHAILAALAATGLVALGTAQPTGATAARVPVTVTAAPTATASDVVVKTDPQLRVRSKRGSLQSDAGAGLTALRTALSEHRATATPLFAAPEAELNQTLNSYARLSTPDHASAESLVAQLRNTPGVVDAHLAPQAVPPPASPDLTASQTNYTNPAPQGLGIDTANTYGIHGSGVTVFDLEYSWNRSHEDLTDLAAAGTMIANGTPVDPFTSTNHGTAVVGELDANPNTFGVTGLAYSASLRTINVHNVERDYDLANAIAMATSLGRAGDVILIEQQQVDDRGAYVPVEYYGEYYDAIKAASAKGLIVIEPAANGSRNLDDPVYGSPFPFGRSDSGAIMVGAGAPANCTASGGAPQHSALPVSNYGTRVNVQGLGACVTSAGYGTAFGNGTSANADYTTTFGGTSSASPMAAAAAALVVQWGRQNHVSGPAPGYTLTPAEVRRLLVATGSLQPGGDPKHIGPFPSLKNAFALLLPSAGAIQNQTVASSTRFTLRAPHAGPGVLGGSLRYEWTQTGGPAATIVSPTSKVTAVNAVTGPATLTFQLRVTDPRRQTGVSSTTVKVASSATLVADAGPDFAVVSGNASISIPLDSSGSGPGSVAYRWMLLSSTDGKGASIKSPSAAVTSTDAFTPDGDQRYTYRLTVSTSGRSATDDVVVSVRPK